MDRFQTSSTGLEQYQVSSKTTKEFYVKFFPTDSPISRKEYNVTWQ